MIRSARGRSVHGAALAALLLGATVVVGCGADVPFEDRVQRVFYCPGTDAPDREPGDVEIEFREGDDVVAVGSVPPGSTFTTDVPLAAVQIYADGVWVGEMNGGIDFDEDDMYDPPAPGDTGGGMSEEGCPGFPSPSPSSGSMTTTLG